MEFPSCCYLLLTGSDLGNKDECLGRGLFYGGKNGYLERLPCFRSGQQNWGSVREFHSFLSTSIFPGSKKPN
jgi:hypothetical protein